MAEEVKIIHECQVSPPQGSLLPTTLPLSHLDLPWFYCPPVKRIFYYNFPHSTQHFLQTLLPILKNSLSLTLQHFFPFSSKIIFPPKPQIPHILYSQGDSVSLTICESKSNCNHLNSNSPKDPTIAYPFVPLIPPSRTLEDGTLLIPAMAIQITIFPNFGFTICPISRHVIADGKAFHHFIKFWSSLSKGNLENSSLSLPLHKREMIQDPKNKKMSILEQLWNSPPETLQPTISTHNNVVSKNNMVRHKINLTRHQIENLKKWVVTKSKSIGLDISHLSTFVVTCSLLWVCKVKLKSQDYTTNIGDCVSDKVMENYPYENDFEDNYGFKFLMDMRNRISIPSTYFGNCLALCSTSLPMKMLVGENGICEAANVIGKEISKLRDPLNEDEEFDIKSQNTICVSGSPKFDFFETDFGWGKPVMTEELNVEDSNALYLSDSRDEDCVIEIAMVLEGAHVKKFIDFLEVQLRDTVVSE